jgi:putative Ca2+/H+ antiporter (TMEM165/GDT1 family)
LPWTVDWIIASQLYYISGFGCYNSISFMSTPSNEVEESPVQALMNSFFMIIASEIGDKTFLIAAILAMRHPRIVVFCGAFGSLVVMSILSAEMGHILPTLIPKKWTQAAAACLFLVFGVKMMMEGRAMKPGSDKIREEMKEAEEEIEGDDAVHEANGGEAIPLEDLEAGNARARSPAAPSTQTRSLVEGARNFCSFFLGPVFVQAFVLTFLGEWGDRSQIATIALGAAHVCVVLTSPEICMLMNLSECVLGHRRHCRRPFLLHRACRHRRTVCFH